MSVSTESPLGVRVSRAELVARELEREIAAGLEAGTRLGTKDDLRKRFRVAVATVNEAVRLLETRGLIEARPGPGGDVAHRDPRRRARDIRELKRILKTMQASVDDPAAFFKCNWALHRRIAELCRNGPLRSMYLALIDFLEFSIDRAEFSDFDGAAMIAVHRDLVEAIDAGEGPQLDAAIEAHQPAKTPRSERWRR
jgi:DNA-binding FadR family transcriptional regulator